MSTNAARPLRPMPGMPLPRPIPIKDRASILFVEKSQVDVLVCLMLEPGRGWVGNEVARMRARIWAEVQGWVEAGNAVLAWTASNDAGCSFAPCGQNRRMPVDLDSFQLVAFHPP